MFEQIGFLLNDYTFSIVASGAAALGVLAGTTGVFAVLRKQSLLGDSIAHSSLAGVALAFLLTQTKTTEVLLVGALIVGILAAFFTAFISENSRVNFSSSMALVMTTFFGIGLMLLTEIQKSPASNQAGLERFLFGQVATILESDVFFAVGVTVIVLCLMGIFWKELKVYSFDPEFALTIGYSGRVLSLLLSAFTVAAVIVGIQMVGVVLISALLVGPAVAARQWTDSLVKMTFLAGVFGAVSGIAGTIVSSSVDKFPAGPAIVFSSGVFVVLSLFFAPGRGLVARRFLRAEAKKSLAADMMMIHLFTHHEQKLAAGFTEQKLFSVLIGDYSKEKYSRKKVASRLKSLLERGMVKHHTDNDNYYLTQKGRQDYFGKGEA